MGVDVRYIVMVGIKKDYNFIRSYICKNDPDYADDVEDGSIEYYKHIVFNDYLPPKYKVYRDCMNGTYSCIGKILDSKEYLDEVKDLDFTPQDLQKQIEEVISEFEALKLEFNKDDIKLHIFVHFS